MKHIKFLLSLLLTTLLGVGQMWATDATDVVAMKGFAGITASGYQNTTQSGESENGIDMVAYAYVGSSGQVRGNKTTIAGASVTSADANKNWSLYNSEAMPGAISKIEVTQTATGTNAFQNKLYVSLGTSSQGDVTVVTSAQAQDNTSGAQKITFTIDGTKGYTYFKLLTNEKFTSGSVSDVKVTITYDDGQGGGGTPTPSLSVAPTTIDFGTVDLNADVENKAVAVTFANLEGSVTYSGLSSPFTASGTISASGDEITIAANTASAGKYSQTLTVQSATDSKSQEVTVKMNVVAPLTPIAGGIVDELKISDFGVTGGYTAFTDKQASNEGHSDAVYAGTVARNGNATKYNIQLNSGQTNSKLREIATSTSGGYAKRVQAIWATQTTNGANRKLTVYGSESAYTGSETAETGTSLGDLTYTEGDVYAYLDIEGDYPYIQIVANGAIYMDQINVTWVSSGTAVTKPGISGTEYFLTSTEVSISCATEGATIYYTTNGSDPKAVGTVYSGPFSLTESATVQAIANVGSDWSEYASKTFTLLTPKTVAEALTALDSENPINNVAVVGIISTAPTSNPSSGRLTYFISDDGTATDELEVYNGYGLNGASFSAKTDLQVGDQVTVFGNLKIFSGSSGDVKEFDAGNRMLSFNRPEVPVTGITLTESTAEVKAGKTVTLHASIVPENATNKTIVWSVQSGDSYASVDNGVVTGIAEGTAVIRAASDEDASFYKECTVTVNAPDPTGIFELFTGDLVEGDYVFVVSDIAMTNSISSSRLVNTPVKITDDAINNPDASIIWHVAASDDYWTIYNAAVEKFAASTGVASKAQMLADGTDDKAKWSVVKNGNAFNFENKANAAGEVNARLSRNGDYGWACYKDYSNIDLYKKADGGSITPDPDPIAEIGGKFIINAKGDTAIFSNGNLQYQQSSNTWRCAPNQYDWAGEAANEQMGNPAYEGWVDLFCWSLGAENNYGATSNNLSTNYHNKDFVDWGGLFSGEWSTLSSAQWSYLLNSRSGANDKWGMAMIEDNLGMILLPNEWTAPAGVTFVPRTNPTSELWDDGDMIDASYDHYRVKPENMPANKFTLAEWEELEAAGAIFLPYAGRRSGGYGNHINKDDEEVAAEYNYTYYENYLGTYWTSTAATKEKGTVNYVYTFKYEGGDYNWGKAVIWSENGRYGQSVRLVHIIPRQYTVTYDINGADGEVPVDAKTYLDGEEITLADASGLSKEGYVFAGWKFKGETYNGTYTVDNVLADEEIVFEAQWELDWQVVRDGLNADEYHTICLDKAVTHVRGASIWRVLSKNDGSLHPDIVLEEVWLPLVAGRPYIFFTTADKLEVVYSGDAVLAPVNDNDNNGLIGSFVQAPIENNPSYYVIYENEWFFVDSDDIKVEANEAYLDMTIVPELSEAAPLPGHPQVLMKTHASGVPTAIEGLNASDKPIKLMMNGQIYILRGDKVYDVTGSQVK